MDVKKWGDQLNRLLNKQCIGPHLGTFVPIYLLSLGMPHVTKSAVFLNIVQKGEKRAETQRIAEEPTGPTIAQSIHWLAQD